MDLERQYVSPTTLGPLRIWEGREPKWAIFLLLGGAVLVALFRFRSLLPQSRLWQPQGAIVYYSQSDLTLFKIEA